MNDGRREYDRLMLRSAFQSLFWSVLLSRKRTEGLTRKGLADRLGVHKSFVTRSFSAPPNWQIDKVSDIADALGVELILEARDRVTGVIHTPSGVRTAVTTGSSIDQVQNVTQSRIVTKTEETVPGRHVVLPITAAA